MGVISALIIQYGRPETFVLRAIIMIILLTIFNIILFSGIRESDEMKQMFLTSYEKAEEASFFATMKTALKTKNFTISCAGYTISITATSLYGASLIYLLRYVYGVDYALVILPAIAGAIAGICTIPFWSNYARKHGFKKTYYTAYIIHGFLFLPFLFTTNILFHTIAYCVYSMIYFGEVTMLMPVASDTYDEVSSRMEKRVDASLVGIRTFFFRIALLVQAVVIFFAHTMTGFDPAVEVQTAQAIWGIRVHTALVPAILMITMGLIFKKYYTLEGKEKEALVKKLKDLGIYR
jgi:Na+/melibiose symporter-like transporter